MSRDRDLYKAWAAMFAIVFTVLFIILFPLFINIWAPCSWLGWMSVKDAPVRCLPHGESK